VAAMIDITVASLEHLTYRYPAGRTTPSMSPTCASMRVWPW